MCAVVAKKHQTKPCALVVKRVTSQMRAVVAKKQQLKTKLCALVVKRVRSQMCALTVLWGTQTSRRAVCGTSSLRRSGTPSQRTGGSAKRHCISCLERETNLTTETPKAPKILDGFSKTEKGIAQLGDWLDGWRYKQQSNKVNGHSLSQNTGRSWGGWYGRIHAQGVVGAEEGGRDSGLQAVSVSKGLADAMEFDLPHF